MSILNFHIVWTVMLVILFVGIVYWAFSSSSNDRFDAAEQLPFEDEQMDIISTKEINSQAENQHESI